MPSRSEPGRRSNDDFRAETLRLLSRLANHDERRDVARALARHLGAEDLNVFITDRELGVLLPAPNLPQTLPDGRRWRLFLDECQEAGFLVGELPFPDRESIVPATGLSADDAVIVLLGGNLPESELEDLKLVIPLLSAAFGGERAAMTAEAEAGISESIAAMANSLMTSLDSARRELQVHLRESEMNQAERAFLADASARLSSSLDFDETVDQIVQMVVPKLGDYATIDVNRDDGQMIQVAQAAVDPEHRQYVRSLRSRYEIDMPDNTPVGYVASTGKSLHFSTDEQGVIRSHTVGIESVAGLQAPNINSALFVPLIARDQTIGVLQLVHAGSRRWHSQRDQALAEDLAKRAALAMENARLYREAREAGQAREEFLSIASHELKTPLTTVKGYIQILQRSVEKDPIEPERVRQAVDHLELQAMRIEALVSDLLDASRIRQGKLELRPETMDLRETTRRVISRFVDAPERDATHSLSLEANEPVYGEWDPFRIDQVISNLVSNALKYSTEGGAIRVLLNCEGDDAVLAVQDEGMGISSDGQANLFEPFFRDPQMQRRVGGTGLGLYITRQIVESHGGSIQVETQRGVGSTFTVRLPRTISLHGSGDQDG